MHIRILEAFVISDEACEDLLRQVRKDYGREGIEFSIAAPDRRPEVDAHESLTALSLAVPALIRNALAAEKDGVDGLMVDCMADPGVEVLRETVSIPVLGPGHTSMYVAAMLGRRFSLLVTTDFSARYFVEHVKRAGLSSKFASCHPVGIAPEELNTHSDNTFQALVEAAEEAIIQSRADTLILSCTGFVPFSDRLRQHLAGKGYEVLLVDPFAATINTLESLVNAGLSQSRIAFPPSGIQQSGRINLAAASGQAR